MYSSQFFKIISHKPFNCLSLLSKRYTDHEKQEATVTPCDWRIFEYAALQPIKLHVEIDTLTVLVPNE